MRRIGPTPCSMPTVMTRSSGTGTWPMRPRLPVNRWRCALRGGCVRPMPGSRVFGKARVKNGKRPGPAVHDDLCVVVDADGRTRHEFRADGPNQLWLTDISEYHTDEGKLYLCAIKDACSVR